MTRILIRACPPRMKCVLYLRRLIPDAEVIMDQDYYDPVLTGRHRLMRNFIRAMTAAGNDAAVHLEDDIILTRDFRSKLETQIAARPDTIIQFFSMRRADLTVGSRWDRNFMMAQCFYMPPGYSRSLLEYLPDWIARNPDDPGGNDLAVQHWLHERRERYWIHCPSLVEHEVTKSQADPRRSSKRQSKTFVDPEV